jgi:hypothetical protein
MPIIVWSFGGKYREAGEASSVNQQTRCQLCNYASASARSISRIQVPSAPSARVSLAPIRCIDGLAPSAEDALAVQ